MLVKRDVCMQVQMSAVNVTAQIQRSTSPTMKTGDRFVATIMGSKAKSTTYGPKTPQNILTMCTHSLNLTCFPLQEKVAALTTKSIAQGVEIETLTKRLADHKERKEQLQTQLAQVRKLEKGRRKGYNKTSGGKHRKRC